MSTAITIVGNLTDDPELKFTPSGAAVANFSIAETTRTFDRQANEWKDGNVNYYRCAAWRELAENVAESLQKGQQVIVVGALEVKNFDRQDGSKGTSANVTIAEIGPSLRFATAKVTRKASQGGGQSRQQQPTQPAHQSNPWNSPPQQQSDPWSTGSAQGSQGQQSMPSDPPF